MSGVNLLSVLLLSAAFGIALCLECHQCNTAESTKCRDPFPTHHRGFLLPCEGVKLEDGTQIEHKFCRKIYQNVRGDERIIRTCGYEEDPKSRECYKTVLEEYNTLVCSCNTSACNAASRFHLGWSMALAPLPLYFIN